MLVWVCSLLSKCIVASYGHQWQQAHLNLFKVRLWLFLLVMFALYSSAEGETSLFIWIIMPHLQSTCKHGASLHGTTVMNSLTIWFLLVNRKISLWIWTRLYVLSVYSCREVKTTRFKVSFWCSTNSLQVSQLQVRDVLPCFWCQLGFANWRISII